MNSLEIRWSASFKAIAVTSPYLLLLAFIVYFEREISLSNTVQALVFTVFSIPVYLFLSLIGWLFVGFPTHYIIRGHFQSKEIYYVAFPIFYSVIGLIFYGNFFLITFGIPAIIQSAAFIYFYKKKQSD